MAITVLVEFSSKPETSDALKQFMADAPPNSSQLTHFLNVLPI